MPGQFPSIERSIIRSSLDQDWSKDPEARLVRGYFGQSFIDQFPGAGPSPTPFSFRVLLVKGVVYMPDPSTRDEDRSHRHWIPCPVQPPSSSLVMP